MSVDGLTRFAPQIVRPDGYVLDTIEGPYGPIDVSFLGIAESDERRWLREAEAEVDAICTALRDYGSPREPTLPPRGVIR